MIISCCVKATFDIVENKTYDKIVFIDYTNHTSSSMIYQSFFKGMQLRILQIAGLHNMLYSHNLRFIYKQNYK